MTSSDDATLQVLHTVRLLGYASTARVSERAGIPAAQVNDALLDVQAAGRVVWSQFEDDGGWSLTEAGKALNERLLADELERVGARSEVESVMTEFEPLNHQITTACTRWQLAEIGISDTATNLAETLNELTHVNEAWVALEERLVCRMPRFDGYHHRFSLALDRARVDPAWVTGTDRESAHRVWFELHENLLATLGCSR